MLSIQYERKREMSSIVTWDAVLVQGVSEQHFVEQLASCNGRLLHITRVTNPPSVLIRFPNQAKAIEFQSKNLMILIT